MATGGAVSRDGRFVALRTYTDAYVWPLTGSDVAAALARPPARIALPVAPQGEAISFGADGRSIVVAGERVPGDVTSVPLPATLLDGRPAATSAAAAAGATGGPAGGTGVPVVTAAVIAAAVATVVVWVGSLFGRHRRRGRTPAGSS
jgi:hypothetical protein